MDNLAKAPGDLYSYGDNEINYQRRFPPWGMLTFSFSYHKITLFENKYGIKLITLISMYHLKPLVSLQVQLKLKCRCTNCFLY